MARGVTGLGRKSKARALTVKAIEAMVADPVARQEVPDGGVQGLYLVIQPSGAKSWAVRYRHEGRPRKMTLGGFPAVGLASARRKAESALEAVALGEDPAAAAMAEKAAKKAEEANPDRDLVKTIVADFLKRHASRNRSGDETARIFARNVLPSWGERRLDEITRRDVIELLDAVVDRGAPVAANRTLAAVRKLFNWAVSRDVLGASPCAGVKPPATETSRDRILSDAELRWFWRATIRMRWPFGPLFRLLLLTAQRRDEVGGMAWAELSGAVWTIPAERAKNGKAHAVPLSAAAVAEIEALPHMGSLDGLVFTWTAETPVSGYSRAKRRLDALMVAEAQAEGERIEAIPHWVLHDLRRTAASGMARCGVQLPTVERLLNHTSGSFGGVAGVYQRHTYADEMRGAVERWAAHVRAVVEPQGASNVVEIGDRLAMGGRGGNV